MPAPAINFWRLDPEGVVVNELGYEWVNVPYGTSPAVRSGTTYYAPRIPPRFVRLGGAGVAAPIAPPSTTTGGVGSEPAPTSLPGQQPGSGGCGCGGKVEAAAPGVAAAVPGAPGVVTPAAAEKAVRGIPWWVWILVLLFIAQATKSDG
jgi:hypothetical protein